MRLMQRLGLIIAVAVAPIVAIDLYNAYSLIEQERAKGHRAALDYGRHAAWEMQRMLDGLRGVMRTIVLSPIVHSEDRANCERFVQDVIADLPQVTSLVVVDQSGSVRCGPASQSALTIADRTYFKQALAGADFVVGDYTIGPYSHLPVLPLVVPVPLGRGGGGLVVVAFIDLQWLSRSLAERGVPPQGSITMADRNGIIIARQPEPERFVGTRIPEPYLHLLYERSEGTIEVTSQDGTPRVLGYQPLSTTPEDIYISAGASVDYSYSGIYAATLRSMVVIALAMLIAILASSLFGRRFIAQPMSRLVAAAERWRAGDLKAKSNLRGRDEFGTLGEVLDQAVEQARFREERITLLVREVTHRVKNQMAVMLSMARHVAKNSDTVESFQKAFSGRIMAMSRSHDLVFSASPEDARLAVLILSQIEPFAVGARIHIAGPEVWVTAQSAQHLGMAIHELATNAMKYGAWSVPAGHIEVTWAIGSGEPPALRIEWKEHGGPNVMPRRSMGFGSTVLESVVGPALGGWSELKFEASGLRWICEFAGNFRATPDETKVA
jgi:two-component sensor histidine kinase